MFEAKDIIETISMIREECLDIRTITMGISLLDCADQQLESFYQKLGFVTTSEWKSRQL